MRISPSIDAVAKLAGVSTATVSRVMNGTKAVSQSARSRVERSVAELGYRANAFGRSLSTGRSRLILVLVPDFANPYYAEIVSGAGVVARSQGYTLLPVDLDPSWATDPHSLEMVYGGLTDGVINMMPLTSDGPVAEAARSKPWVNCSEFLPGSPQPYVSIDHTQAACDAVQYLINRGHRQIALVTSDERYLYARQRRQGYEEALQKAGLPQRSEFVRVTGGTSYELGRLAAGRLMAIADPPTAIFAVSDTLAIGAIKALRGAGIRVPSDVAVVGFDNLPIAQVIEPTLTTISQPMHELGAVAAQLLLKRLAGEQPESRILPHALALRESA